MLTLIRCRAVPWCGGFWGCWVWSSPRECGCNLETQVGHSWMYDKLGGPGGVPSLGYVWDFGVMGLDHFPELGA